LEEINILNADIASYKEQLQLFNTTEQSSGDQLFQGRTQTVKGLYQQGFTSTTDLGPMIAMTSNTSYSVNPNIHRQGTETMVSAAFNAGSIIPAATASPRAVPEAGALSSTKSDTVSVQVAKVAELESEVESLTNDLQKAKERRDIEMEKERESKKADQVKHQEEIGKMQEEANELREEVMRLKTEMAQSKGCCGSCSVM